MSPFGVAWLGVDIAALVPVAVLLLRHEAQRALDLRVLLAAQLLVIASAIAAGATPLHSYAEWTLMAAVNLGYALASWRGGAAARSLATMAIVATTLAAALIVLRSFSYIVAIAIGLVFAMGALFAALVQVRQARARA